MLAKQRRLEKETLVQKTISRLRSRYQNPNEVITGELVLDDEETGKPRFTFKTTLRVDQIRPELRLAFLAREAQGAIEHVFETGERQAEAHIYRDQVLAEMSFAVAGHAFQHQDHFNDVYYESADTNADAELKPFLNEYRGKGNTSIEKTTKWMTKLLAEGEGDSVRGLIAKVINQSQRKALSTPAEPTESAIAVASTETKPISQSALKLGTNDGKAVFYDDERCLISVAPPGSGKTQCHVLPNLRTYAGSCIILDIKGECYDATAEDRKQFGDVLRFDPTNPAFTNRYNPLAEISTDPQEVWEDARLLASMIVVSSGSVEASTWENQAREFLTLAIACAVMFQAEKDATQAPQMGEVLDYAYEVGTDDMLKMAVVGVDEHGYPRSMKRSAVAFMTMKEDTAKQYTTVLSTVREFLAPWSGVRLEEVIRTSEWRPAEFRTEPLTLYICIPPDKLEQYRSVLRAIIGQHVRGIMSASGNFDKSQDLPVLFMLDELPRLGKMEPVREALEVGRSYGIKLWMICQYEGQLREAYSAPIANGMIGACGAQIYMNPSYDDAEHLSKRLGMDTNPFKDKVEPIMTPQQLMAPEFKNQMLVFMSGEDPMTLTKQFDFER